MTDPTIFSQSDQDTSKQTSQQQSQAASDTGTHLATLVGDARKYKTAEDLAKAYINIDEFAERLKGENADLRARLNESKTVQDVLDRLNAEERQSAQDQSAHKTDSTQSSLSASDVAAIVKDTLTGLETQRSQQDNLRRADAEMRKLFGDKAPEVFNQAATTPELRKSLMALAAVSPEKFVAVFHQPQVSGSQVDSTNRGAPPNPGPTGGRENDPGCKEYYNNLRRTDPRAYYSQHIQLQMTQAAEKDPNKFFPRS
jgi:hypothetical protein